MRQLLSFALLLLLVPHAVEAQLSTVSPWVVETINSRALGPRTIYIATPTGYDRANARYPVLVTLDANDLPQFRLWIAQTAYLAANSPGLPPMILVGIVNGSDRIHDMTPPATGSSLKDFKTAGGAAAFAEFIIGEVLPHVRAVYRTLPTTILAGHSAGALFALDVAARRPDVFQGIVAMSPAIWFNDGTLVDTYAESIIKSAARPRLFLTSGGDEPDVEEPTRRLAQRLTIGGLQGSSAYRAYPNATHSLTPLSCADGLQFVFDPVAHRNLPVEKLDPVSADTAAVNGAIAASERAYSEAARSLHLPEQLPERVLNRLGSRLMNNKQVELAIPVFERNIRDYPESLSAYDGLSEAFIAAGNTESALAHLQTAAGIARRTGVTLPAAMQKKLDALGAKKN
jgi:predicted alpha/beta superfamily hydrolase